MIVGKQELHRGETRFCRGVETIEERNFVEHHAEIGGKTGHRFLSFLLVSVIARSTCDKAIQNFCAVLDCFASLAMTPCHCLSPGSLVPVTRAYIRATEASSSRPMPEADVIKNICSAAADTGTGNFAVRAMSWMMPRSLTKISTALRGA